MIQKIQYEGKLGQIYKIWLVNIIYSIFTLGIHSFWGKTRMRKYLARCLSLDKDRFEYTGRGIELFKAFVKVTSVYFFLAGLYFGSQYLIVNILDLPFLMTIINVTLGIAYVPGLFFLIYFGYYSAFRYRLSKTRWRGIRFQLSGSAVSFAFYSMLQSFKSLISLGLLIPSNSLKRSKLMVDNMSYGNLKFSMNYSSHNLNKVNIITLLLALPTFGLSRIWFHVALSKFVFKHTKLGDLHFTYTMSPAKRIGLYLAGFFITALTLGLGYPIVIQMYLEAMIDNVEISGDLSALRITQSNQPDITSGEGLEAMLGEAFMV